MISEDLKRETSEALALMKNPIELIATIGHDHTSSDMSSMLGDIASLSEHITLNVERRDDALPSFEIVSWQGRRARFAGLPLGDEFTSMILGILWASGHPPRISDSDLEKIRQVSEECDFEVYYALNCPACPSMVQSLTLLAMNNSEITATFKDALLCVDEAKARGIVGLPTVFLNGELFSIGRLSVQDILVRIADPSSRIIPTLPMNA